jgi:hypothetical protein
MRCLLKEADYKKIFGPEVMQYLKGKSGESLRQLIGDKNFTREMIRLVPKLSRAEEGHREELAQLAVNIVKEIYPIIDEYGIEIDARIVPFGTRFSVDQMKRAPQTPITPPPPKPDKEPAGEEGPEDIIPQPEEEPAEEEPEESDEEQEMKRRLVNSIIQGSSLRGAFSFLLFRDHINDIQNIDPEIVNDYRDVLKATFAAYDDDNGLAMLMSSAASSPIKGGESKAVEENGKIVIKAWSVNFPMLVHEIIKGLKSITVGWAGYASKSAEKNAAVVKKVDKLSNEPEDLRYGKFVADALTNIYIESNIDDPRVRDAFETEVAKLKFQELKSLIINSFQEKLTPQQKSWISSTFKDLERQWKQYDADKTLNAGEDEDEEDFAF